jgi:sirohydrochlorin ferrochelatase
MTYLTGVTPPDTDAQFATAFDNSMRSCLGRIFQDDISDAQWMLLAPALLKLGNRTCKDE